MALPVVLPESRMSVTEANDRGVAGLRHAVGAVGRRVNGSLFPPELPVTSTTLIHPRRIVP